MISLTLENLSNGQIRATGRIDGRTVAFVDGSAADGERICLDVLNLTAPAHKLAAGHFDFTHIRLNEAARLVLES